VQWGEQTIERSVCRRSFTVHRGDRRIPGVLYEPAEGPSPRPVVLVGHGASATKDAPYVVAMARRLVRHHGVAAAAIDGPLHGERRADGGSNPALTFLEFSQAWANDPELTDQAVADSVATLDALTALASIEAGAAGYLGFSMGTILGLPFVAAEPRIAACALGLMGSTGPTVERICRDAAAITIPTYFLCQWDDELFERAAVLDLFDRLGAADKVLLAHPGAHAAVPTSALWAATDFVAQQLSGARG